MTVALVSEATDAVTLVGAVGAEGAGGVKATPRPSPPVGGVAGLLYFVPNPVVEFHGYAVTYGELS